MHRTKVATVGLIGLIGLVSVAGFSVNTSAALKVSTQRAFTENVTGAHIGTTGHSFENAYKVTGPLDGAGAGVEEGSITATTPSISGASTLTDYFADGAQKLKETFTLGAPNVNSISTLTGSGKCVGGTGVHKTQKCTYTFTGTDNEKTTVYTFKVTGTYTR
jgi:hypothetical protein